MRFLLVMSFCPGEAVCDSYPFPFLVEEHAEEILPRLCSRHLKVPILMGTSLQLPVTRNSKTLEFFLTISSRQKSVGIRGKEIIIFVIIRQTRNYLESSYRVRFKAQAKEHR